MDSYRGELIFVFMARIAPMDFQGTAGPQEDGVQSGYDTHFREPVFIPDGTQTGRSARRELEPVNLPCQVEDEVWEQLQMMKGGNSPQTRITLVFHFADLEQMGLVDAETQEPKAPRVGDRLAGIYKKNGMLAQSVPEVPGVFCVQAAPRAFGFGGERNLLVCVFEARDASERGGS